MYSRMWIMW